MKRRIFLLLCCSMLFLPLLGLLGVRSFAPLSGVEPETQIAPLSASNFFSGKYFRSVTAFWAQHFFLRNEFIILRNSLFDLANANTRHAGLSGRIIRGEKGILFEKPYIDILIDTNAAPRIASRAWRNHYAPALQHFATDLATRNIRTAFIAAPSKPDSLRDLLPPRYKKLLPSPENSVHVGALWQTALQKHAPSIVTVSESDYTPPLSAPKEQLLFPSQGTHWTLWYASQAIDAVFSRFPSEDSALFPKINAGFSLNPAPELPATDKDIGILRNTPWCIATPTLPQAHLKLPPPASPPSDAKILVFGDSFSEQVAEALKRSGKYKPENIICIFNSFPTEREFHEIINDLDLLVFVWAPASLFRSVPATTAEVLAHQLSPRYKIDNNYSIAGSLAFQGPAHETREDCEVILPGADKLRLSLPLVENSILAHASSLFLFVNPDACDSSSDRPLRLRVSFPSDPAAAPREVSQPLPKGLSLIRIPIPSANAISQNTLSLELSLATDSAPLPIQLIRISALTETPPLRRFLPRLKD